MDDAQIVRDIDRDYEAVLDFAHEVQEISGDVEEFELSEVCEANEIYVTAGEKGREDSSPVSYPQIESGFWGCEIGGHDRNLRYLRFQHLFGTIVASVITVVL